MTTRREMILGKDPVNIILFSTVRSGHNFIRQQIESWGDYNVCNAEDLLPENFELHKPHLVANGKLVDWNQDTAIVVVIRDLLNWWASYVMWVHKSWKPNRDQVDRAFKIWIAMVEEASMVTDYVGFNFPVNYDIFKKNRLLRKVLCDCIGGEYNEDTLDQVTPQGNGSSFDSGYSAKRMDTHLRYQHIMKTQYADFYTRTLREHPEAIEVYKKHMGGYMNINQKQFLIDL